MSTGKEGIPSRFCWKIEAEVCQLPCSERIRALAENGSQSDSSLLWRYRGLAHRESCTVLVNAPKGRLSLGKYPYSFDDPLDIYRFASNTELIEEFVIFRLVIVRVQEFFQTL